MHTSWNTILWTERIGAYGTATLTPTTFSPPVPLGTYGAFILPIKPGTVIFQCHLLVCHLMVMVGPNLGWVIFSP